MKHIPVLLQEVIEGVNPRKGMVFLDGTFGAAGHSLALSERLNSDLTVIALDTDAVSLDRATTFFKEHSKATLISESINFRNVVDVLTKNNIKKVDAVLLDLGFSSDQIETGGRGISFMKDEPLLMTLKDTSTESDLTAREIVNTWDEQNIADIIKYYGDERFARRIARAIVEKRAIAPINTTADLVEVIKSAVPASYGRKGINPATRTFQALRITVNDELGALKEFIEKITPYLATNGRIAIISFHSLEDRIVKRAFLELEKNEKGNRITKKPIIATDEEVEKNPRSRSAKLRIFETN